MRGLHEVVPEPLPLFDRGADLLSADELDGDVGPPQGGVLVNCAAKRSKSRIVAASVYSPRSASISKRSTMD
jgi:hypothetical protein